MPEVPPIKPPTQGERVTSLEVRMTTAEMEIVRTRDRLHELEQDRKALQMLGDTVSKLVDGIPEIAKQTAEETVASWWEHRIAAQRDAWRYRLAWVSAGGVIVGTCGYLLDHLVR